MIHVRAQVPISEGSGPVLQVSFVGRENILKLQAALARCLNTAPDFGQDWFDLADGLDRFISENSLARPKP